MFLVFPHSTAMFLTLYNTVYPWGISYVREGLNCEMKVEPTLSLKSPYLFVYKNGKKHVSKSLFITQLNFCKNHFSSGGYPAQRASNLEDVSMS